MLSVGIVGLPNAGKSTLFNALLGRQIASTAPYPFCTIEPNVGIVEVPDERLTALKKIVKPKKTIPAVVKFIDIAGLVKGAYQGEGLGNKFLAHIREVDVICFVLRAFESNVDKAGSLDPATDLKNLKSELLLKDLETIEKIKNSKLRINNDNLKFKIKKIYEKLVENFNKTIMAKDIVFSEEETEFVKSLNLLTFKPYFVVLNVNEKDLLQTEKIIDDYKSWIVIPICAKLEEELADLKAEEQKEYLRSLKLGKPGLERLIKTAYEHLGLISFFTTRSAELKAWTIKKETKASQAGGVIHTDFEKGFIKAKIINWKELVDLGGWNKAAEKGKVRFEGKDYEIQDGDVVEFMV